MNVKKIIFIGGGALVLMGGAIGGTLFMTGAFDKSSAPGMDAAMALDGSAPAVPALEVFYHRIQPEFVVNFYGKSRAKHLMIELVVGTHDEMLPPILSEHDPEIRDALLTMLAEQDSEELKTVEGKQALREKAVAQLDEIAGRYYRTGLIKDVYITRMVMQ